MPDGTTSPEPHKSASPLGSPKMVGHRDSGRNFDNEADISYRSQSKQGEISRELTGFI